ncbi:MAG: hypothetical protein JO141_27675 [Bradyrhizobium sp.]|nr:hypothetical protein [Bradyrhizobium sp.]
MLRRSVLATFGLLATVGPVTAQTPQRETPPASSTDATGPQVSMEDPQMGDHWTYEVRDQITGELRTTITTTVTDVSAKEVGMRLTFLGKPNFGYQTFDLSWNYIENGDWRFSPNDGTGIQAPLAVGKTWSIRGTDVNRVGGFSWKRSGTSKVTAKESITTQAGTFEAFKIETSVQLQNTNDPTKKVQFEQQTWYVPAINHWVKRISINRSDGKVRDSTSTELIEFGRR